MKSVLARLEQFRDSLDDDDARDLLYEVADTINALVAKQSVPRGAAMKAWRIWLATREGSCNSFNEAYRAGYWDAVREMGSEIVDDPQ